MKTQLKIITMYTEIKNLFEKGHSKSSIHRLTGYDRKTVRRYLAMTEDDLENWINQLKKRTKKLAQYEQFVYSRIDQCPDCSAAQVEDWLKEHYPDFPTVSSRTIFSFVQLVRHKYNLPKPKLSDRQYEPIQELPYGEQAQVDFGECWMFKNHQRVKVYFMVMVLSRSRHKFVCFTDQPINTWFVIMAHEMAFAYFGGIPKTIVYDQDSTILNEENRGSLIYTQEFERYLLQRKFKVFMCRKADPETKGKVENVVKYVKYNFLRGRIFISLEILNQECLAWLERTANAKVHGTTYLVPQMQWQIEKDYLTPYVPIPIGFNYGTEYGVRKDNCLLYKGNRYTLPTGTYQGPDTRVAVKIENGSLVIHDLEGKLLASVTIETGKGKLLINNNHLRDRTEKIKAMEQDLVAQFSDQELSGLFITQIHERFPRYVRDQFSQLKKTIQGQKQCHIDQALEYCMDHLLFSSGEFYSVFTKLVSKEISDQPLKKKDFKPVTSTVDIEKVMQVMPQTSNINDYQKLLSY